MILASNRTETNNKAKTFISYSHKNKDVVHNIAKRLENTYSVWIDKDLLTGVKLFDEIAKAIADSLVFICFISEGYILSDACQKELTQALSFKEKKIFPIFLERVDKNNGVFLSINTLLRFNAYEEPDVFAPWSESLYERLINQLSEVVKNESCKRNLNIDE